MKKLQRLAPWLAVLAGCALSSSAAVPAPEQLLPDDTLAVLAVPDFARVRAAQKQSAMALLWDDPAMKPFRDKLMNQLQKEVIDPIEKELGIKLADYADLAQGQVTAAITRNGWSGTVEPLPGLLVLMDARDRKDQLQKSLELARRKITDAGQKVRTEKIRGAEFMVVTIEPETVKEALDAEGEATKIEVAVGQADSLLVVATNLKDADKVLARLAGGSAPCLADQSAFQGNATAMFREAFSYGWIHFAPLAEVINKFAREAAASAPPGAPPADKVVDAFGLNGLKTLAFAARHSAEGDSAELLLGAPEAGRKGLFRLIATEAREASPPAFVPADAVTFNRWRLDGQKFWAALEALVNDIVPGGLQGATEMINEVARQKDPGFDLKKSLVANLGDDLVTYAKAPRGTTLEDLSAQPSILLVGSSRADQLVQALRALVNGAAANPMLPLGGELKEREFLGRKIYSMDLPAAGGSRNSLMMAASGGYVAFGTDTALIEEFLRSADDKPRPLSETPGFKEAASKVGGTSTGLFGFQNDKESLRPIYETLRANNDLLSAMFGEVLELDGDGDLKNWLDFSLLPAFDRVAKYFGISVFAGSQTRDGYLMKVHTPMPATARP
jgi:hypothetical protein